jgi:hypothetical protein
VVPRGVEGSDLRIGGSVFAPQAIAFFVAPRYLMLNDKSVQATLIRPD